jgi:squalene cyclase
MMNIDIEARFKELSVQLASQINNDGFWTGELSSSALGVAVAVAALHFYNSKENSKEISEGLDWLTKNINSDGSYGDTPDSPGNISTTLLVYSAVNLYVSNNRQLIILQGKMADYLLKQSIDIKSGKVHETILAHYKKDFTFSVPILTMCALCGIPSDNTFEKIPQLPFELSLLPRKFYRMFNLSVVSYAIPALIAVGIVIFKKKNSGSVWQWIRRRAVNKSLAVLERIMPDSGGFLEAVPLTAFVSLSLVNAGYKDLAVVRKGISFLKNSQRSDGGWAIDIDLSTWVSALSIKALRSKKDEVLNESQKEKLTHHLLSTRNKNIHPFNGTGPGGWGWTSFSGSVPDGDDTPGVILSLLQLQPKGKIRNEVLAACNWLLKLQNKDGGFPTFSKGWGKLPFDQSCADVTGHCLLALSSAMEYYSENLTLKEKKRYSGTVIKASFYLYKNQNSDGSFLPLWFGNQYTADHTNPVYGTARVLSYLNDVKNHSWADSGSEARINDMITNGTGFLLNVQNPDGSWGGNKLVPGTIEETSLAISALIMSDQIQACYKGLEWLDRYYKLYRLKPAPIGLYFASLWYHEKLYPLTAYLEAITRAMEADLPDYKSLIHQS